MTVHVNIGEAKTRLSQLIAAALRGEEVVLDKDGKPQVQLVPVPSANAEERARRAQKRESALGMWKEAFEGWHETDIGPSMTDQEVEARWQRKFGPSS
jgi:antitoxin (DNA-binding transcriptional repressor) of toxin-antitoxin stability system